MQNLKKRCAISTLMGIGFGLLCFWGFSTSPEIPEEIVKFQEWSLSNVMMWSMIANRMAIGFTVGLVGFVTVHPFFKFKIPVFARGFNTGIIISLSFALGTLMGPDPVAAKQAFWMILIFGGIIGMIIDMTVTKFASQGKGLLDNA